MALTIGTAIITSVSTATAATVAASTALSIAAFTVGAAVLYGASVGLPYTCRALVQPPCQKGFAPVTYGHALIAIAAPVAVTATK